MAKTMLLNMNEYFMDNDKRPLIIIGDKTYAVDDTVEATEMFKKQFAKNSEDRAAIYKIAFGEKAGQEIVDLNLRLYNANLLYIALLGIYKGDTQSDVESTFRKLLDKKQGNEEGTK